MIDILYKLYTDYMSPILRFCGCYCDEKDHLLKPSNLSDSDCYTWEDKKVIIIQTIEEYEKLKMNEFTSSKYEMFNPFLNTRHMIFVGNLMKNRLSELVEPIKKIDNSKMVWDDDLDMLVPANLEDYDGEEIEDVQKIGMYQGKAENGSIQIQFSYQDKSGNPFKPITLFNGPSVILAIYGACLNAIKIYNKVLPLHLLDTNSAINEIYLKIEKYHRERLKYKELKKEEQQEGIGETVSTKEDLHLSKVLDNIIYYTNDLVDYNRKYQYPWNRKEYNFTSENYKIIEKEFQFPHFEINYDDVKEILDPLGLHDISKFNDLILI